MTTTAIVITVVEGVIILVLFVCFMIMWGERDRHERQNAYDRRERLGRWRRAYFDLKVAAAKVVANSKAPPME